MTAPAYVTDLAAKTIDTGVGYDDNVGTIDEAMVLESNVIPAGAQVSVTDLTYEVPRI